MQIVKPSFKIEDSIRGRGDGIDLLRRIERAGRTCYKSECLTDDSAKEFVAKRIKEGHHSILEHEKITVRIVCDRGVSHEIVRHRIGSYSQESTRYCNYSKERFGKEISVIEPPKLTDDQRDHWLRACHEAEIRYMAMLDRGCTPQIARSVLPTCLKTEIVVTYNVREWRHFFTLRTAKNAHPQMREIICPLLAEFRRLIPVAFDDVGVIE